MVNATRQHPPRDWAPPEFDDKEVHVLTGGEFTRLWAEYQRTRKGRSEDAIAERYQELTGKAFDTIPTTASPAKDAADLTRLARDLRRGGNMFTTYRVIRRGGEPKIAFRGNHRLRRLLRGTLYNMDNAQLVRMAIGPVGHRAAARAGIILTVIVSPAVRGLEWLFDSETLWDHLLANVTSDLVKGVVAAGAYLAAASLTATVIAASGAALPVIIPIGAGIVAAFGVGWALDRIDDAYEISEEHLANAWKAGVDGAVNLSYRGTTWIKNTAVDVYEYLDSIEPANDLGTVSGPEHGVMDNPARHR